MRDLATGADLADIVAGRRRRSSSGPRTASAFYYVRLDDNHRPSRVYRHRLGTPASDDALVFEEADDPLLRRRSARRSPAASPTSRCTITRPRRCWLLDLDDPDATPRLVAARETGVQYDVEHHPTVRRAMR